MGLRTPPCRWRPVGYVVDSQKQPKLEREFQSRVSGGGSGGLDGIMDCFFRFPWKRKNDFTKQNGVAQKQQCSGREIPGA